MERLRYMNWFTFALLVALAVAVLPVATPVGGQSATPTPSGKTGNPLNPGIIKERVTFKSGDLTLVGFLFRPNRGGSFPAIIWNHGSEQKPSAAQFDGVAAIFVPAGYVVLAPLRRGHGDSEGPYISDQVEAERKAKGKDAADKLLVQLMEGPQLDDQLAGQAYLKSLPYVDKNRLAVVGCSYGGIQTLLGAERGAGYKAAVAISPGAESWNGNKYLRDRLVKAVSGIDIPVFLIHPEKDANVAPGYTLGQEFQRLGKPYGLEIYPPFGPADEQGHCFGGARGFHIWEPDVLRFLSNAIQ